MGGTGEPASRFQLPERVRRTIAGARVLLVQAPPAAGHEQVVAAVSQAIGSSHVVAFSVVDPDPEPLAVRVAEEVAGAPAGVLTACSAGGWTDELQTAVTSQVARAEGWRAVLLSNSPVLVDPVPGVAAISGRDLLLDRAGVAAELEHAGVDVGPVVDVWETTAGWPGLVALALSSLRGSTGMVGVDPELVGYAVRKRIRQDVIPWVPAEWLPFLTCLALAGGATVGEVDALAADGMAAPLTTLLDLGVVVSGDRSGRPVLRLGAGLAEAVVEVARRRGDSVLEATYRRIADVRERLGELDGGLAAAYALEDWPRCARILATWWLPLT